jgi:DNA-binding FrmR family transcriptional regulator
MSSHEREKVKLLQRVRKLRGQLDAVERAITADDDCGDQLMLLAAASNTTRTMDRYAALNRFTINSSSSSRG